MRVVIQRVERASVVIDAKRHSSINHGVVVLLGVEHGDTKDDVEWLANKISALRIFDDHNGVMNLDIRQIDGEVLVVSQFTLHASTKKGNRPSYIRAAEREIAIPLYEYFIEVMRSVLGKPIMAGVFGADMKIELVNDGPVTIIIDSKSVE